MLPDAFYAYLASAILQGADNRLVLSIAVGEGRRSWDIRPPEIRPDIGRLTRELARRKVAADGVVFLDPQGNETDKIMPELRIRTAFDASEAVGSLRECGLFASPAQGGADLLIAYYTHPVLNKSRGMILERSVRLDLGRN